MGLMEVLIFSGALSSMWPASFGRFACINFGPCPLFLFLLLSWVLSCYGVWQGFDPEMWSLDGNPNGQQTDSNFMVYSILLTFKEGEFDTQGKKTHEVKIYKAKMLVYFLEQ
jgi:hypothetical protein